MKFEGCTTPKESTCLPALVHGPERRRPLRHWRGRFHSVSVVLAPPSAAQECRLSSLPQPRRRYSTTSDALFRLFPSRGYTNTLSASDRSTRGKSVFCRFPLARPVLQALFINEQELQIRERLPLAKAEGQGVQSESL